MPANAPPTWRAAWPRLSEKSGSARPSHLVITGITPRNDNIAVMPVINEANAQIARLADGKKVRYININEQLAFPDNQLREGMANDGLHLTPKAYQVWADALKPIFTEILGPPAADDRAPPPTGDPSAQPRRSPRKVRDLIARSEQDRPQGEISEVSGVHARVRDRVSRRSAHHQSGVGKVLDRVSPAPRRQHRARHLRRRPPARPVRHRQRAST